MITNEMKIEIGRMIGEGVSDEGIQVLIEVWDRHPMNADSPYARFVEHGLTPLDASKTVEGSIVEPIIDKNRLVGGTQL